MNKKKPFHSWLPFTSLSDKTLTPRVVASLGIYLILENGQKVMDMISSWWVSIHGHAHPLIAKAISTQAHTLEQVIYANFSHSPAELLQEKLTPLLPSGSNTFFFSDNGSTAVEVALKMAFQYWQNIGIQTKKKFLSFEGSYHGDTVGAMSLGERSLFTDSFSDLLFHVTHLPYPETWIGDLDVEEKEKISLTALETLLEKDHASYAALMIEPLAQGAGGIRICREVFLQKLERICRHYDILIIYDEVMTGFGRTGDWFAATKSSTHPDIICLSKALTGGFLPMALTVVNERIHNGFLSSDHLKTFYHGHSYTANPLGCAAALASLDILQKNEPFRNFEEWHREFLPALAAHPLIEKPRTLGTIAAFNLKTSVDGYHNATAKKLQTLCFQKNLFLRPLGNVVYLMPPYITTKEELKLSYEILLDSLEELVKLS